MLPEYQSTIEFSVTRKQLVTAGKELNQLVGQLVYTGSATVGSGIGGDAFYKVTYESSIKNHLIVRRVAALIQHDALFQWATEEVHKIESRPPEEHARLRSMRSEAAMQELEEEPSIPEGVYIPEGW